MAGLVEVTDDTFEMEVLKTNGLVLTHFWADSSPSCSVLAPLLEELADNYAGRVKVATLNVDRTPKIAASYDIRAVPTLIVFNDGRILKRFTGVLPIVEYLD